MHANTELDRLFQNGRDLLIAKQPERALPLIQKAIKLNHNLAGPQALLGQYYMLMSDYNTAIICFIRAKELNPQWALPNYLLGICFFRSGKLENAINMLKQAIRLEPELVQPFHELTSILLDNDQDEEALEYLQKAKRFHPEDGKINLWLADLIIRSNEKFGSSHLDSVPAYLDAAESAGMNLGEVNSLRGYFHTYKKEWKKSAECFRDSLKYTYDPDTAHNYAASLSKCGETEKALQIFFELHQGLKPDIGLDDTYETDQSQNKGDDQNG